MLSTTVQTLARALPPGTGVTDLLDTMRLLAQLPSTMKLSVPNILPSREAESTAPASTRSAPTLPRNEDVSVEVDTITRSLPLSERLIFASAPIRWRDPFSKAAALSFFRAYEDRMQVDFRREMEGLGLIEALADVQTLRKNFDKSQKYTNKRNLLELHDGSAVDPDDHKTLDQTTLQKLESLHSTLVVYMWLSYRLPLGFYQGHEAEEMKNEVERGIEWCLERIRAEKLKGKMHSKEAAEEELLNEKARSKRQIQYLSRDAVEQWRSQGSTAAAWDHMLKNNPRQATG
jgi:hypothetical protein